MRFDLSKLLGIRYRQRVVSAEISLERLPAGFDGLKVLQLTDMHRGTWVSERYVARAVARGMQLAPELIVLTGDYVSNSRYSESLARALAGLRAPLGVYAVLGNHDHWSADPGRVVRALENVGVTMLTNRAVPLSRNGGKLWLAGIDDIWAGQPDLDLALGGFPDDEPAILLCHEPDYAPEAAKRGVILQLSGHSHGGQVRLPGLKPVLPRFGRIYPIGLMKVIGTQTFVYVSGGLGVVFPPIRWDMPPEVALLTLRRQSILDAEVAAPEATPQEVREVREHGLPADDDDDDDAEQAEGSGGAVKAVGRP